MLSSELDFDLPPELIAQSPVEPRDASRLLRFRRHLPLTQAVSHHSVHNLPEILLPDDLLVFNDTRVLRARLLGRRSSGGRVEALLLREREHNLWEALLKPSARLKVGETIYFSSEKDAAHVTPAQLVSRNDNGWLLRFEPPDDGSLRELLPQLGHVPVPPYIQTEPREEQYQTVYAQNVDADGLDFSEDVTAALLDSCAAPTAGLHFSPELLEALNARGVKTCFLTLGVGVGTFRPIQSETLEGHLMHEEEYFVSPATAEVINAQRQSGQRVIAVGTTTLRVLESVCDEAGKVGSGAGRTSIFIRPGFRFRCVDALMTNFHLPRSTLLALVAAFLEGGNSGDNSSGESDQSGLEALRHAYALAISQQYRFFSFGDAMFIE